MIFLNEEEPIIQSADDCLCEYVDEIAEITNEVYNDAVIIDGDLHLSYNEEMDKGYIMIRSVFISVAKLRRMKALKQILD